MKTVLRRALSCATLLALSACGNKGPLVLPEKPAPVALPADTSGPAPAAEKGAIPPVQIVPQNPTNAPTSEDQSADKALDSGPGGDD